LNSEEFLWKSGKLMNNKFKISSAEFQAQLNQGIALVDFGVSWCAPCRIQETIIDSLCRRYLRRAEVVVMDLDENRKLAADFFIQSVPTLILFKNGEEVCRFVGLQSEDTLSKAIEHALE